MKLRDDTRIAGDATVAHWTAMNGQLAKTPDPKTWQKAFNKFFKARLETRYFHPIRVLEKLKQNKGEGFAIVVLHCSLVEFLASTLIGKSYKYQRNGQPPLGQFEYSNSSDMFIEFLEKHDPFKTMFSKQGTAKDFYAGVRCGLLHEARTKNGWQIKVDQSAKQAIDTSARIVYRNKMQAAFEQFVNWYEQALPKDAELQKAFIRKIDSLCEE